MVCCLVKHQSSPLNSTPLGFFSRIIFYHSAHTWVGYGTLGQCPYQGLHFISLARWKSQGVGQQSAPLAMLGNSVWQAGGTVAPH